MWWCGAAIVVCECVSERATINCHGLGHIGATCDKQTTTYLLYIADNKAQAFSPGIDIAVHCCIDLCAPHSLCATLSVCLCARVCVNQVRTQPKSHTYFAHLAVVCRAIPTISLSVSFQPKQMDFSLVSQNTHTHPCTAYPRRRSDEKTKHIYVYIYGMAVVCLVKLLLCLKCVCARLLCRASSPPEQNNSACNNVQLLRLSNGRWMLWIIAGEAHRDMRVKIFSSAFQLQWLFFLCDAVVDNSHWCNRQTPPLSLVTGKRYATWHKM